MDAEIFERVYDRFQQFHAFFVASFGRKQWREHSRNYLQALLVQAGERRNAENLSESVGISARAMLRFLTEARWSDDTVIGRLKEYLAPRLGHAEAVWVFDGSDFPKQGRKSVGGSPAVLRPAGQGGQLPGGDVPGLRQPAGPIVGGQRAVSARELDFGPGPLCGGGGAGRATELPEEDGVGPGDAGAGLGAGSSQGPVGCRGRRLRNVAVLPGGTDGLGDAVRPGRSGWFYSVAAGAGLDQSGLSGIRAPPQTQAGVRTASYHGAAQ